jgi:hypothetical protein
MAAKAENPEARLQAAVARDIAICKMEHYSKNQALAMSVAKWEVAMGTKDEMAKKSRAEKQSKQDSQCSKLVNKANRKKRLQELYLEDELKYEEELNNIGMSFRRDRC